MDIGTFNKDSSLNHFGFIDQNQTIRNLAFDLSHIRHSVAHPFESYKYKVAVYGWFNHRLQAHWLHRLLQIWTYRVACYNHGTGYKDWRLLPSRWLTPSISDSVTSCTWGTRGVGFVPIAFFNVRDSTRKHWHLKIWQYVTLKASLPIRMGQCRVRQLRKYWARTKLRPF